MVLQAFLKTPPRPYKKRREDQGPLRPGDCFVVINGALRIAHPKTVHDDESTAADLHRNHDNYRAGRVTGRDVTYRA